MSRRASWAPSIHYGEVENLCKGLALKAFGLGEKVWWVNVQPFLESLADFAVYIALLAPYSRVMGLDLRSCWHWTHGNYIAKKKISATSVYFESLPYKVIPETDLIDSEKMLDPQGAHRHGGLPRIAEVPHNH